MFTFSVIGGALILAGLLMLLGRAFGRVYLKLQGGRVITCPENQRPAGVEVDAGRALLTTLEGHPEIRLKSCSRWPENRDCGQECLRQIEAAPEDCLVSCPG